MCRCEMASIQHVPVWRLGLTIPLRMHNRRLIRQGPRAIYQARSSYLTARANQYTQFNRRTWLPWFIAAISTSAAVTSLTALYRHQEHSPTAATESTASTAPIQSVAIKYDTSDGNIAQAISELCNLLGHDNIETHRNERTVRANTEWSPAPSLNDIPSVIVYPRSAEDVSAIAKICHRRRIPMIAFAGGTSLEGTLAAQHSEVCLDFNRHMNKIIAVRKDDMDVTVQPSVSYQDLNAILAEQDMFFPPDPGPGAQIGGMVAMGCSGTNAYRYGTMKDWVLGLEVVLADGTIIKTRARPRKSSSGYDLTRLFVGAEGTLGFITKIHLKVTKKPDNLRVAVAQFPSLAHAVSMAVKVVQSGYQLEAMELLDDWSIKALNLGGYCSRTWDEKPTLFFKLAGPTPAAVEQIASVVQEISRQCDSTLFSLAQNAEESDEIWHARKTALWATLAMKEQPDDKFLSADSCVPISRLADIIAYAQKQMTQSGMVGSNLGHVGDGNFHASLLYRPSQEAEARRVIADIQRKGIEMDGTVSGEHGIGLNFRDAVVWELGEDTVNLMRRIKLALDPLCLLNPGKMIRLEQTTNQDL